MGLNPLSGHWSHELSPFRSSDWSMAALAHGPCVRPSHGVPQRPMAVRTVEQRKEVAVAPVLETEEVCVPCG